MTLSAVVLTHNNQDSISSCLSSLSFCDEIIVIDDYSTDKTIKLAKKFKTKIFQNYLNNNFANQRNFGLRKAKGEWVLFLDSDEIISLELNKEILTAIKSKGINGFKLKRHDFFFQKKLKHGEIGNISLLRLARKNAGHWKRAVHEYWEINGQIKKLKNPILHFPEVTITQFIHKINYYTDQDLKALIAESKPFSYFDLLKPPAKFIYFYFYKLGFLDGMEGFVIALLMSLHSLMVRIKLWEYAHA